MTLRSHHESLVVDFLARGGTIQKIPPPKPTVAADILQYLQERNVDVRSCRSPVKTKRRTSIGIASSI